MLLTEERQAQILNILQDKKAVSVTELTIMLNTSESTIRRDLTTLNEMGKLKKVHGGATLLENTFEAIDEEVAVKASKNVNEKIRIAKYAASTIKDQDFVFLDAGTTTEKMIDFLPITKATYVTNGIVHAKKLIQKGHKAYIIGGQLKLSTEAVIGSEAMYYLKKYNFTKSFLGANGISIEAGFSTPDPEEALIKEQAIKRSYVSYVLADHSKFNKTSAVSFGELAECCIVTDKVSDNRYYSETVIKEV